MITTPTFTENGWYIKTVREIQLDGQTETICTLSSYNVSATYGGTVTAPTITVNSTGAKTFTSSDTSIATVSSTGAITMLKAGTVTITVNIAATQETKATSASYELVIAKAASSVVFTNPTQTVTVGADITNVATPTPNSLTVTYTSSDQAVATVDSTGKVHGVTAGSVTITGTVGNDCYKTSTAQYTLTVNAE